MNIAKMPDLLRLPSNLASGGAPRAVVFAFVLTAGAPSIGFQFSRHSPEMSSDFEAS